MTSDYMGSYYDSTYGYGVSSIGNHMGMLIFAVILIIAAMIAAAVMNILCCVGLSHAFGKGAGFACGLIFLNVIFICIIAFNKNIVYVGDGYNSNNNYYNPYGSNGYGQQYGQNMYGNGANQQYGQNMYGNGANQQYGQNMYGNGANQQYGQNMYGNGANQQYGQNPYGTAQGGDAQNSYGTSQQQSWNDEYNNKDYE